MSEKILVPVLGESVTEATVSKWLKNKGDKVTSDEPLVELETDKVNVEVPSPKSGVLGSISAKEGQTVNVGSILGVVEDSILGKDVIKKEDKNEYEPPLKKKEKVYEIKQEKKIYKTVENKNSEPLILEEQKPLILEDSPNQGKQKNLLKEVIASPSARKIAMEKKINLNEIKGTGKNGIILKNDLIDLMGVKPQPSERKKVHGPEERIKMTRLRLTIAKRLKEAQENAAMLTTFNEVDMTEVMNMRRDYKDEFQKKYDIKLGFMSFFVKACVLGLKNYPSVNAEIQNDEIIFKNYYNISFAVGTEKGLVVPVLRNCDEMSFADIETDILKLGTKARDVKITIEDLQGGTFTISNGGIYGSMLSTPILNPPQSAVLGMHNIIKRSMVINDEIKIRPMMYLALSYDHRIIDGKEAVSFLKIIKESLEQPERLFLNL